MNQVFLFLFLTFIAFPAYADELVVNADTGVNVHALKARVDLAGVESFVPKAPAEDVQQGLVISNDIVRISNKAPQDDAAAMNAIVPAAGESEEEPSDGGELGKMPLTASEEFARGRLKLGQGARP